MKKDKKETAHKREPMRRNRAILRKNQLRKV